MLAAIVLVFRVLPLHINPLLLLLVLLLQHRDECSFRRPSVLDVPRLGDRQLVSAGTAHSPARAIMRQMHLLLHPTGGAATLSEPSLENLVSRPRPMGGAALATVPVLLEPALPRFDGQPGRNPPLGERTFLPGSVARPLARVQQEHPGPRLGRDQMPRGVVGTNLPCEFVVDLELQRVRGGSADP